MKNAPRRPGNWKTVFAIPLAIGALSLAGLLSALLLDQPGRIFSWFALGLPVAIAAWAFARSR
ncbi:hypothetical protein [Tardiphaga sp.]|uniref:hypothetical protein n=1 Tax=Tardiphaga sp. TaxID=1926292 RepID=UPI002607AA68|nr:hypothetical protein [Tardiphaga sp.]MDB5620056.1 hypothetical protein [Tardiphaga sp.]